MTLADKIEGAEVGSRELDSEIWRVAFSDAYTRWAGPDRDRLTARFAPPYTTSIDAAMTLVPEGALFTARTIWDGDKTAGIASVSQYETAENGRRYWMREHQSDAATPALALCVAALRAKAQAE